MLHSDPMAAVSAVKRLARLGGWLALSTGAMVAASLGAIVTGACNRSSIAVGQPPRDASIEGNRDGGISIPEPQVRTDAGEGEAGSPVDADQTDLWNVICE
jgi:hypothetical protein